MLLTEITALADSARAAGFTTTEYILKMAATELAKDLDGAQQRNPAFVAWMALRLARWACWIGFLVYAFATTLDRPAYLSKFGQPLHTTEAWLFGLVLLRRRRASSN